MFITNSATPRWRYTPSSVHSRSWRQLWKRTRESCRHGARRSARFLRLTPRSLPAFDSVMFPDNVAWTFVEALGSALSRCHYGLEATGNNGSLHGYTSFPSGWHTILHRDVKPGNGELPWPASFAPIRARTGPNCIFKVLVALRNSVEVDLITRLGDSGTSFQLEDGGALPTSHAGTRVYWAPVRPNSYQSSESFLSRMR